MRIALITTSFPAYPGDAAGAFVEREAVQLSARGHEVHVLAPGRSGPSARDGISIWHLGANDLFGWPGAVHRARESPRRLLQFFGFAARARWRLSELCAERTIAHFVVPCAYPLSLATSGPLEVVLHGSDARAVIALPSALRHHVAGRLLARGAHFRFSSERLRREFLERLPAAQADAVALRSRVELPDIALPTALSPTPETAWSEHERWVACGRLIASKGVDRVIREAAKRGVELTIIGDGPERAALQALATRVWPLVRFTGQLPRAEALALIARCDRLVHLSELEGAPTVIREARALGVRVLASPAGDVADWAKRDPGIELFDDAR